MVLSEAEAEHRLAALRREREALDRAIADLALYLELGRRLTGNPPSREPGTDARASDPPPVSRAPPPDRTVAPAGSPVADGTGMAELAQDRRETRPAPDISEGALARRYGRALIREAVAVLAEAGRPLHASEILSALAVRGFSVPGQQDPVAALNTRLWKRSGPGGPLQRLGDAIYAPAEGGGEAPG